MNASQTVTGNLRFVASSKISYTVTITLQLDGTHIVSENKINLADQMYHYLQGSGAGAAASGGYDAQGNWTGGYTGQRAVAGGTGSGRSSSASSPPPPPSSVPE